MTAQLSPQQHAERDEHGRRARVPDPPTAERLDRLTGLLRPLQRLTRPYVEGLERLPQDGALYAGNHSSFAVLDAPFMIAELWQRREISVRPIGDHGHYAVPGWREAIEAAGVIRGTRANVRTLMAEQSNLLVFPGGAAEVFRPRGRKYELMWKERIGFAKLAIESGYPIVPFAAVGAEEMLDIVFDTHTPGFDQVSSLIKSVGGWSLPPIPAGIGPTLVPRFQRLYFSFREPVDTSRFAGDASDRNATIVRDEVRAAVIEGLDEMQRFRQIDPDRKLSRVLLGVPTRATALAGGDPGPELVTRAVDAWNHLGPGGLAPLLDRRACLIDSRAWAGAAIWWGRASVTERLRSLAAGYDLTTLRVRSITEVAPEQVDVRIEALTGSRPVPDLTFRVTVGSTRIQRIEPAT